MTATKQLKLFHNLSHNSFVNKEKKKVQCRYGFPPLRTHAAYIIYSNISRFYDGSGCLRNTTEAPPILTQLVNDIGCEIIWCNV